MFNNDKATKLNPLPPTPWWGWLFVGLCILLVIGGGLVPSLIGFFSAITARNISRNPKKSSTMRVLQSFGMTVVAWVGTIAVVILSSLIFQPQNNNGQTPYSFGIGFPSEPSEPTVQQVELKEDVATTYNGVMQEQAIFEVAVEAGDILSISVPRNQAQLDWVLSTADGDVIANIYGTGGGFMIEETGNLLLTITNFDRMDNVSYEFEIATLSEPTITAITPPLNLATKLEDTIEFAGQQFIYDLSLEAGDNLTIDVRDYTESGAYIYLNPVDGTDSYSYRSQLNRSDVNQTLRISHTGIHRLIIEGNINEAGYFNVDLWRTRIDDDNYTELDIQPSESALVEGEITFPGEQFVYEITLPAQASLYIEDVREVIGPQLSIRSSTGWESIEGSIRVVSTTPITTEMTTFYITVFAPFAGTTQFEMRIWHISE
ncbi:MAG: hypothetical protein AAFV93_01275 [Chloroflexota bacterium]